MNIHNSHISALKAVADLLAVLRLMPVTTTITNAVAHLELAATILGDLTINAEDATQASEIMEKVRDVTFVDYTIASAYERAKLEVDNLKREVMYG